MFRFVPRAKRPVHPPAREPGDESEAPIRYHADCEIRRPLQESFPIPLPLRLNPENHRIRPFDRHRGRLFRQGRHFEGDCHCCRQSRGKDRHSLRVDPR